MSDPVNDWEEEFDNLLADAMLSYYNGRTLPVESNEEFRQAFDALHDFVRKLADKMPEWMPIETAPKDGTRVLVWNPLFYAPVSAQFYGEWWGESYELGPLLHQPTRWLPLPAAPAPEKE